MAIMGTGHQSKNHKKGGRQDSFPFLSPIKKPWKEMRPPPPLLVLLPLVPCWCSIAVGCRSIHCVPGVSPLLVHFHCALPPIGGLIEEEPTAVLSRGALREKIASMRVIAALFVAAGYRLLVVVVG